VNKSCAGIKVAISLCTECICCGTHIVLQCAFTGLGRVGIKRSFAERSRDIELLRARLAGQCACRRSCFSSLRSDEILPKLVSWRASFADLHKVDQDRLVSSYQIALENFICCVSFPQCVVLLAGSVCAASVCVCVDVVAPMFALVLLFFSLNLNMLPGELFDMLRELALGKGLVTEGEAVSCKIQYNLFGVELCRGAFCVALGVGSRPRLTRLWEAVVLGRRSPPLDPRYIQAPHAKPALLWGEVHSYLQTLYESTAETMPHDDTTSKGRSLVDDDEEPADNEVHLPSMAARLSEHLGDGLRFLPPGSIFEQWRQFIEATGQRCSFRLFWSVWKKDFGKRLAFRSHMMHSVCPVCVKHKLLLTELVDDVRGRVKQRMLYDRHLALQYKDRQAYWALRASSRLRSKVICIILDGMDQAKFMWPRSPFFSSHEFDNYSRPRLHIWGALVHGYGVFLTVSHADVFKGGSTTVEFLMMVLETLTAEGLDLHDHHVHVQLDNTSGSNKNNTLLAWAAAMCASVIVGSLSIGFLRVGHTHEDRPICWYWYVCRVLVVLACVYAHLCFVVQVFAWWCVGRVPCSCLFCGCWVCLCALLGHRPTVW